MRGTTRKPSGPKPIVLTADETLTVAKMHRQGRSLRAICRVLKAKFNRQISPPTLMRMFRVALADRQDIRFALASLRAAAVESWHTAMVTGAVHGKSSPAERLLEVTGDIEADLRKTGPTITIVVGDGRTAIGELPAIPDSFRAAIDTTPALPATREPFDGPAVIDVPATPQRRE